MTPAAAITNVNMAYATKMHRKYLAKKTVNAKGCFIPDKVARSDGYVRCAIAKGNSKEALGIKKGETTYYLHHLAWYVLEKQMPVPVIQHLSHLCGDGRCFNTDHLSIESPEVNNSRKNCKLHCPHCGNILCKHDPNCI
jgi:hypothetical protein